MLVRSGTSIFVAVAAFLALQWVSHACARAQETVDFQRDVQPILADHCWKCHGEMRAAGGLRLDQKRLALRGGGSGKNPLSLSRQENELLRRVRSMNPEERMPPKDPPLSETQIATLERWIAQGAAWPEEPMPAEQTRYGGPETSPFWQLLDRWEYVGSAPFRPVYITAIGLLLVMLVIERAKNAKAKGAAPRSGRVVRQMSRVSRAWYLAGFFALVSFWLVQFIRDQAAREKQAESIAARQTPTNSHDTARSVRDLYRPQHPPRLGGTYYRGNDERSPDLFNGGFYRTATFDVHLADAEGNKLAWGDPVPERPHIRFEISRSPHSSPSLFDASIMDHVFVTAVQPEQLGTAVNVPFTNLAVVTKGEHWTALCPLEPIPNQGRLTGKLFVYKGHSSDQEHRQGDASYVIGYELIASEGKISRESQIWMASAYNVSMLQWPEPGQIPADHWFDFRPIPEIEK